MSSRLASLAFPLALGLGAVCTHATATAALPTEALARFALVMGVNRSVDPDAIPLRYADDDAAQYQDLFRSIGARTYLLARLDENTRRLHPQAAAEAIEPTRAELARVLEQVTRDVALARARHLKPILYLLYSGHGGVDDDSAYISLEDARLSGSDLQALVVDQVGASEYHLIVDACYSYFLANPKGAGGGKRRGVHGFAEMHGLTPADNVGLLFSTSSARESHEWAGFESGVFSHEVRSGLYGAADVDGDGRVSYAEIAAFVKRANEAIPNERFRPDVYARAPKGNGDLLDLRRPLDRRIEIDGSEHAHYQLEDSRGVRLAEFHNSVGQKVSLIRTAAPNPIYLRRTDDETEFDVPAGPDVVRLADLEPRSALTASRGAAAHAFRLIFTLPFDRTFVHELAPNDAEAVPEEQAHSATKTYVGAGLLAVGAAGIGIGTWAALSGRQVMNRISPDESGANVAEANRTIGIRRREEWIAFGVGAAAAGAGIAVLLWPNRTQLRMAVQPNGVTMVRAW